MTSLQMNRRARFSSSFDLDTSCWEINECLHKRIYTYTRKRKDNSQNYRGSILYTYMRELITKYLITQFAIFSKRKLQTLFHNFCAEKLQTFLKTHNCPSPKYSQKIRVVVKKTQNNSSYLK